MHTSTNGRFVTRSLLSGKISVTCWQVVAARLCAFHNATCGGFQALTQHGYLSAQIQNTGSIAADYTISVRTHPTAMPVAKPRTDSLPPNNLARLQRMQEGPGSERCMVWHE